jgi:hypothetical protein
VEEIRRRLTDLEYREHALRQMTERGIHPDWVGEALLSEDAEIIEGDSGHFYGPCCLILGWRDPERPLHVVLATSQPLKVISVWNPSADSRNRWEPDFKTRRASGGGPT